MTKFTFPFPALVCDTGGTNVRFALVSEPGGRLSDIVHLHTGDYPGLAEAIEAAVPRLGARPRSIIACGAGPVVGRTLKLTNAPWVMDGPEAARRTGLAQGLLLNDFEAQALSLPTIPEGWERRIGPLKFGAEGSPSDPRARDRARRRRAGRGRRTFHSGFIGGLPYRFWPGPAGGIRDLAASGARTWAYHQRERYFRRGARARPPRAHDRQRGALIRMSTRRPSLRRRWLAPTAKRRRV